MATTASNGPAPARERGIALIVGLVILAVLSLIGVAAFSVTTQEERMAGNSRDRMRAFEAAEAALRYCETTVAVKFAASGPSIFGAAVGLYAAPSSSAAPSITESKSELWWQNGNNVLQLLDSNGNPYNGNAVAPSCVAEQFSLQPGSLSPGTPLTTITAVNIAHITAHGYGLNANTIVRLESYYAM